MLGSGCGSARQAPPASGIPRALLREARPIGRGPRFRPGVSGPVLGRCSSRLGARDGVHVEVFAANRVVIVAAGIGTRPPLTFSAGRIAGAGCYGDLVTLEPTGVVLHAPRITASLVVAVPCVGPTAVVTPAGRFLGIGGRAGRGVRRWTTLAWCARRRAAVEARGDRARGRPVRPPASLVHVSARQLITAAPTGPRDRHARRAYPGSSAGAQETSECQA